MAVTLPQPGEEYAPEVRHAHKRELELGSPLPTGLPLLPQPVGPGQDTCLLWFSVSLSAL